MPVARRRSKPASYEEALKEALGEGTLSLASRCDISLIGNIGCRSSPTNCSQCVPPDPAVVLIRFIRAAVGAVCYCLALGRAKDR